MERYISERLLIESLLKCEIEGPFLRGGITARMNEIIHSEVPALIRSLPGIYIEQKETKE